MFNLKNRMQQIGAGGHKHGKPKCARRGGRAGAGMCRGTGMRGGGFRAK